MRLFIWWNHYFSLCKSEAECYAIVQLLCSWRNMFPLCVCAQPVHFPIPKQDVSTESFQPSASSTLTELSVSRLDLWFQNFNHDPTAFEIKRFKISIQSSFVWLECVCAPYFTIMPTDVQISPQGCSLRPTPCSALICSLSILMMLKCFVKTQVSQTIT